MVIEVVVNDNDIDEASDLDTRRYHKWCRSGNGSSW